MEDNKLGTMFQGCLGLVGVIVVLWIIGLLFGGVRFVNPTDIAVVSRWGNLDQSPKRQGFHFETPFFNDYTWYDLRVQTDSTEQAAATKDLQDVKVNVTVSFKFDPTKIVDLYSNVGNTDAFKSRVLIPATAEAVKVVTTQYSAQELLVNRAGVTTKVGELLRASIGKYSVDVVDVALTNIEFTNAQFNQAIDQKQIAEQQALQAKYELDKVKIQAEQQRAQQLTLTPQILQKMWIEKWDGKLPQYMDANALRTLMMK